MLFVSPDSEGKILVYELSDEEIVTENLCWAKAADAYSTLLKFAESRPCYLAQELIQLHILYFTFLREQKECTKQADIRQVFQKAIKSHADLLSYQGGRQWSVSIREESGGIGWWNVK
jgi:hypothetical protein